MKNEGTCSILHSVFRIQYSLFILPEPRDSCLSPERGPSCREPQEQIQYGRSSLWLTTRWCNGNTRDFGSLIHGSNPCRVASLVRQAFQPDLRCLVSSLPFTRRSGQYKHEAQASGAVRPPRDGAPPTRLRFVLVLAQKKPPRHVAAAAKKSNLPGLRLDVSLRDERKSGVLKALAVVDSGSRLRVGTSVGIKPREV
jgi:hypothetical protein